MVKTNLEKNISSYIGRLLRDHFGRGPGNVICTVSGQYVVVHMTSFLSSMEKSLINNDQTVYVEKIRDLMVDGLVKDITSFIELNSGQSVEEFYYDWELQNQTGMMIALLSSSNDEHPSTPVNQYKNSGIVIQEINRLSKEVQKTPENTYSIMIDSRNLLIIREGIFISLEKELIRLGFQETLRIAKRNLEKQLIAESKELFEESLEAELTDFFIDWNFEKDRSVILFNLSPSK
ncbi:DUF2294 family protein [Bacillus salacetis]|uniref:DUF2294 family protein n=1 Tax=Bacillus salacetis TaxID=2315464 RepID=A0A3A1QWS0_9BACI|nr:Na-translocating system protein MpsC family protein [Bacillus salacetis]RIW32696.1 DUF2294 family protein [Bacillus salacetis]